MSHSDNNAVIRLFPSRSKSSWNDLCFLVPNVALQPERDPCIPSPCGANSICQLIGETAACSCSPNYIGSPPNCRPECTINSDCPRNKACIREKCKDPCLGSCGFEAICSVFNHVPICTCREGYTGNPFEQCRPQPLQSKASYIPYFIKED